MTTGRQVIGQSAKQVNKQKIEYKHRMLRLFLYAPGVLVFAILHNSAVNIIPVLTNTAFDAVLRATKGHVILSRGLASNTGVAGI